ncbi:hypothetical protein Bbelb_397180 [Branchiostoma belcheri]|nr:hypothetical protein Bbelb_397180 [Branchiostoma belcheri]
MASSAAYFKRAKWLVQYLRLVLRGTYFVVCSGMMWIACLFPPLRGKILSSFKKGVDRRAPGMLTTPEQCQQYLNERASLAAWKGMLFMLTLELEAEVFEGGKATDSSLVRLDGSSCRLLQHARAARPLVISFGSNT